MANFIPKQYKKEPVIFRVTSDKLELIDKSANKYNLSRSEFINQCVDFALENMPDKNRDQIRVTNKKSGKK